MAACAAPRLFGSGPVVWLDAGRYPMGSDRAERARGYELSPPAVRRAGWYDAWERRPHALELSRFGLDRAPVTHVQYARFVAATGHRPPDITAEAYAAQGFLVHPFSRVERYRWRDGAPPEGLADHPVVLVSQADAEAYCAWRGARLPREAEWEAACRGAAGRTYPWGDDWREGVAQVAAEGTAAVGSHPGGATPEGISEMAGNVFEWTGSAFGAGRTVLKSCSWDDAPGTCRCAFRHGRPPSSRHILIGFRCAR